MVQSRFPCPHCFTALRIQDRRFIGQTIECPDCQQGVFILSDEEGRMFGIAGDVQPTPATEPSPTPAVPEPATLPVRKTASQTTTKPKSKPKGRGQTGKAKTAPKPRQVPPREPSRFVAFLASPLTIAWLVAGGLTALIVVSVWPDGDSRRLTKADPELPVVELIKEDNGTSPEPIAPVVRPPSLEDRMLTLGNHLRGQLDDEGVFPQASWYVDGQPFAARFSWQARLVAQQNWGGGEAVDSGKAWSDPINERFVRQPIPELLNPTLPKLTGSQGFPTTHFVGVAGVGFDGLTLPATHPRAGIFGIGRQTRREQVTDGLSNTMLIAPVREGLGSWAKVGRSTIRSFAREPYINGPDGFGSGDADRMPVLMADGSVRMISKEISPSIVRRMAAMNDGLPLDASVPGEPGETGSDALPEPVAQLDPQDEPSDTTSKPEAKPEPEPNPTPDSEKIVAPQPLVPPEPQPQPQPNIDWDARLGQNIASFNLADPQPLAVVVEELGEMLGTEISWHPDVPDRLRERKVSLTRDRTTVGKVLEALLTQAGLEAVPEGNELRVRQTTDGEIEIGAPANAESGENPS